MEENYMKKYNDIIRKISNIRIVEEQNSEYYGSYTLRMKVIQHCMN